MRISDTRAAETPDGWQRIGQLCTSERRSVWMRLTFRKPDIGGVNLAVPENVEKIELCGGREGDDTYCVITHDNPQFADLLDFVNAARYAMEI